MEGSDHESREGRIPGLASLEGAILPPPFTVSAQRIDLISREWRDPTMPASVFPVLPLRVLSASTCVADLLPTLTAPIAIASAFYESISPPAFFSPTVG